MVSGKKTFIYIHIHIHKHTYAYISTYCTLMHLENWLAFNAQLAKLPRDVCSILTLGRNTRRNSGQAPSGPRIWYSRDLNHQNMVLG